MYYQSTSKEFIEFLRDENTTDSKGQELYDLWNNNGKCPPEVMATATITLTSELPPGDIDGDCDLDADDITVFVAVLLGLDLDPQHVARSNLNGDGAADGADIQPFTDAFLSP